MIMTAPRVDEARLREPGRWWDSSPTNCATSTEHLLHQPGQGGPTLHDR
jgi:hypothetical protein